MPSPSIQLETELTSRIYLVRGRSVMLDSDLAQIAISKTGRHGRRNLPFVFTEHGAIMQASVLNSKIAVAVRQLIDASGEAEPPHREIGFHVKNAKNSRQISRVDK